LTGQGFLSMLSNATKLFLFLHHQPATERNCGHLRFRAAAVPPSPPTPQHAARHVPRPSRVVQVVCRFQARPGAGRHLPRREANPPAILPARFGMLRPRHDAPLPARSADAPEGAGAAAGGSGEPPAWPAPPPLPAERPHEIALFGSAAPRRRVSERRINMSCVPRRPPPPRRPRHTPQPPGFMTAPPEGTDTKRELQLYVFFRCMPAFPLRAMHAAHLHAPRCKSG
jgi:hypothetical protein